MAKNQPSAINGDLSYNADNVYADLKICDYAQNLTYASTSGWVRGGTLSVAGDQSFSCGVDTIPVDTGAIITTKDDLVERLTGEASLVATDLNPHAARYAQGTTLDIQWDTDSSTAVAGTVAAAGGAVQSITLENSTQASSFAVNDVIKVPLSTGNNIFYWPAIISQISDDTLTLKYAMPEAPADAAIIQKVFGYDLYHGGNVINNLHVLVQLDFPKGDQHILDILKCSMTGGFTRQLGGAVKTPLSLKMYGTLQDVGSLTDQVICAITRVQFPNT